jgi:beta-lactamase class D
LKRTGRIDVLVNNAGVIRDNLLPMLEDDDLKAVFDSIGAKGTFALHDPRAAGPIVIDANRAAMRMVPASTFKIANSLIALETGAVKDENEVIPFGGRPQMVKAWERDMALREAITASNVPVFQEIARRVGLAAYRTWLAKLDYGNRQTGSVVDQFWLRGPLEISAIEQARFASLLGQVALPVSARSQTIVRSMLRVESAKGQTLFGKTGWWVSEHQKIGWWTGWVETTSGNLGFSLNIDMPTIEDAPKRIAIGKAILAQLGIL